MTERNERVEALLCGFVLDTYRQENGRTSPHHASCTVATVAELDASDGSYGCETGCDYVPWRVDQPSVVQQAADRRLIAATRRPRLSGAGGGLLSTARRRPVAAAVAGQGPGTP